MVLWEGVMKRRLVVLALVAVGLVAVASTAWDRYRAAESVCYGTMDPQRGMVLIGC